LAVTVYNVALLSGVVLGVLLVGSNDPAVVATIYVLGVTLAVVVSVAIFVGSKIYIIRFGGAYAHAGTREATGHTQMGKEGGGGDQQHSTPDQTGTGTTAGGTTTQMTRWTATATSPQQHPQRGNGGVLISHTSNAGTGGNNNRSRGTATGPVTVTVHMSPSPASPSAHVAAEPAPSMSLLPGAAMTVMNEDKDAEGATFVQDV
jgi:hypothetical protein